MNEHKEKLSTEAVDKVKEHIERLREIVLKAQAGEEVVAEDLKAEELQNAAIDLFKDLYKDGGEQSSSEEKKE